MKNSKTMEDMETEHLIKDPTTRYYVYVFMVIIVFAALVVNIVYGSLAVSEAYDTNNKLLKDQEVRDMVYQLGVLFGILTALFMLKC